MSYRSADFPNTMQHPDDAEYAGASEPDESLDLENPSAYPASIQPGIPRLGTTPSGWIRYLLGDLLRRVERPATLVDDQTYQLVTAKRSRGGIVRREVLRGHQIRTKTQFYIENGDFLISNRQISHGVLPTRSTSSRHAFTQVLASTYQIAYRDTGPRPPAGIRAIFFTQ